MANYSLKTAIQNYAFVGETVVKLSKVKTLAFWQTQAGQVLLDEHAKNAVTLQRKLASGFLKSFSHDMVKGFNADFTTKRLMQNLADFVDLGELSVYAKNAWGRFIFSYFIDLNSATGFDYLIGTAVNTTPNGNVNLVYDADIQGFGFRLLCEAGQGHLAKVPNNVLAKVTMAYCSFMTDDPLEYTPIVSYETFEIRVNSQGVSIGGFASENAVSTYALARIEFLELDSKGQKKKYQKGKFDTIQIMGLRI